MTGMVAYRGTGFTCDENDRVEALVDHLFCVDADGIITAVLSPDDPEAARVLADPGVECVCLSEGQYLLPGFVDLHVHAPQWAQAGTALDRPLSEWLNDYTFPLEARFADAAFARSVYTHLVSTLLGRGTTTALYFATVHRETSLLLAEICAELGQRGLVGKVVMDDPATCPDYYRDADAADAVAQTAGFIADVRSLRERSGAEVYPVITPRFIPSCTDEALRGLGELAATNGVHVQSHCAESDWEDGYVRDRCGRSDADALHGFGLLGERSVMAHCVLLGDADVALFASTGTAVAHCPLSNAYFGNAVAPVRRYRGAGVDVGLGTDVSGGYSPSIGESLRQAVVSSRMLDQGVDPGLDAVGRGVPGSQLTFDEAFAMATSGGGRALSLPIGRLAPGFSFDAQLVDVAVPTASLPIFGGRDLAHVLHSVISLATPENIRGVWVKGRKVMNRV